MKTKVYKSDVLDTNEKGIVTIAISKFDNTDSYGDIVKKGAFTKTFKEGGNRIKHVIDHKLNQSSVVGLPMKMYENDTHAVVESALNLEKQIGRDLFSDYKFFNAHGKTLEHSYGYATIKGTALTKDKSGPEIIHELKMFEYSTVARGANAETPLLSLKSDVLDVEMLEEYLRKFDVSKKHANEIENIIKQLKQLSQQPRNTVDSFESVKSLNLNVPEPVLVVGEYKLNLNKF